MASLEDMCTEEESFTVFPLLQSTSTEVFSTKNIPKPPPLPRTTYQRRHVSRASSSSSQFVAKETVETWDKLFKEGLGKDAYVYTDDKTYLTAHSCILAAASPVLAAILNQSREKNSKSYLKIPGVPYEAVDMFIRFLYSSCYEEEAIKNYVLHLLVLSHCYTIPSLKRVCVKVLEQGWINKENVIDVLQLARLCDVSKISVICVSMVIKDFKSVPLTEGWKAMARSNPLLEQELLENVIEIDTRKQERVKKLEERKVYLEVYESMEALVHICREGCGTIGPCDKALKGNQVACKFPACKGLEGLLRHFTGCKSRAKSVKCSHCKRMWQLFELHSRICDDSDSCKVPICRQFKEKKVQQCHNKKEEARWRLLADNIVAAKNSLGPFVYRSSCLR